jgi:hypothetical protein
MPRINKYYLLLLDRLTRNVGYKAKSFCTSVGQGTTFN